MPFWLETEEIKVMSGLREVCEVLDSSLYLLEAEVVVTEMTKGMQLAE